MDVLELLYLERENNERKIDLFQGLELNIVIKETKKKIYSSS
jgi:hypothetical protein